MMLFGSALPGAEAIDPAHTVSIRVTISELGACIADCTPALPATGIDGLALAATGVIAVLMLAGGALLFVRRRQARL